MEYHYRKRQHKKGNNRILWVYSHDVKLKWNGPNSLKDKICQNSQETGNINWPVSIKEVASIF